MAPILDRGTDLSNKLQKFVREGERVAIGPTEHSHIEIASEHNIGHLDLSDPRLRRIVNDAGFISERNGTISLHGEANSVTSRSQRIETVEVINNITGKKQKLFPNS